MTSKIFLIILFLLVFCTPSLYAKDYNVSISEGIVFHDDVGGSIKSVEIEKTYDNLVSKIFIDVLLLGIWLILGEYILNISGKGFFKRIKNKIVLVLWLLLTIGIVIYLIILHSKIITYF